jgi:hypothetical protein
LRKGDEPSLRNLKVSRKRLFSAQSAASLLQFDAIVAAPSKLPIPARSAASVDHDDHDRKGEGDGNGNGNSKLEHVNSSTGAHRLIGLCHVPPRASSA